MPHSTAMRLRLVALGLAVTALVALAALASRSSTVPDQAGGVNAGPAIVVVHLVQIVGLAVEIFALLLFALAFRLARRRRQEEEDEAYHEPPRVHWAVKLLLILLPLLMLSAFVFALYRFVVFGPADPGSTAIIPPPPIPAERNGFLEQVSANADLRVWEVLIAVVLAGVAFFAIVRLLRAPEATPGAEPEPPRPAQVLAAAVTAGLRDARLETDPRRSVIVAYATMEAILTAQGLPRRSFEAPLEYMARLLAEADISADAIGTLTELFELARFSQHEISAGARMRAIAALTAIERELRLA